MTQKFATFICIVFIFFLFWTDRKREERFSRALWIPFLWMFFGAGRYFAEWLDLSAPGPATISSYSQGNQIDAVAFAVLIAAGLFILSRRNLGWENFLTGNKLVWLYILYCLISVLWADAPFVSFKRWIKEFGNLVMVLVILTEERPYEALGLILRRLGYLWLPLSVLFIKYFPALGRAYSGQGGQMYIGIGMQKNELGSMCLISWVYYAWRFIVCRKFDRGFRSIGNVADLVLLVMLVWLFRMSHSATSFSCAVVAMATFGASCLTSRKPNRIMTWGVAAVLLYLGLKEVLGLDRFVIRMLGRNQDLTGRTEVWNIVKEMAVNPWTGAGYQSFWLGERLGMLWEKTGAQIIQAHNGYLEQYLELGCIGLAFIVAIMLLGRVKVRRLLQRDYAAGVLMLSFIEIACFFNYTEAAFYAISNVWLLTVLAVTKSPVLSLTQYENIEIVVPAKLKYYGLNEPKTF